jgi:hypothetical protein
VTQSQASPLETLLFVARNQLSATTATSTGEAESSLMPAPLSSSFASFRNPFPCAPGSDLQMGEQVSPIKKRRLLTEPGMQPSHLEQDNTLPHDTTAAVETLLSFPSSSRARPQRVSLSPTTGLSDDSQAASTVVPASRAAIATINANNRMVIVNHITVMTELRRMEPVVVVVPGNKKRGNKKRIGPALTRVHEGPQSFTPDLTQGSFSTLIKRIRNVTGTLTAEAVATATASALAKILPSTTASSSPPASTLVLPVVHSFGMRTLLLEDVMELNVGKPVMIFFREDGLPPRYFTKHENAWKGTGQCNVLPMLPAFGGRVYYQMHGTVQSNIVTMLGKEDTYVSSLNK